MLACLTDFFDGYLARKENLKTSLGKYLDPIADKVLIITMCIILIINKDILGLHKLAFYIIILREIIITFLRLNLDNENKSIEVSKLSKYKTFMQMVAIGSILIYHNFELFYFQLPIIMLVWLAAFVTLITGVQHFKTYLKLKQK
jgi:CDP-diacylglycerol--glycerol-3-phosphate 3-phosphatidyltransferase